MMLTYPYPDYGLDQERRFMAAIKPFIRECETCGGSGEYETEYGPRGCNLCSSRLIPVTIEGGVKWDMDWGDQALFENGKLVNIIRGAEWKEKAGEPVVNR